MEFFRLIFRICSSPAVFTELAELPLRRVFVHLLMLATLLALLVFAAQYFTAARLHRQIGSAIVGEFGELSVTPAGLQPTRQPERARNMALTHNFLLSYNPGPEIKTDMIKVGEYDKGIIWTPGLVLFWQEKTQDNFVMLPLLVAESEQSRVSLKEMFSSGVQGIAAFVKKHYHRLEAVSGLTMAALFAQLMWGYLAMIYFAELLRVIGSALLFNTLFTGCYSFAGGAAATGLPFRKIFIIGMYSGFPALMVASLFSAFDLPLLDFNTVYLFGFLGYFLIVLSRIQRERMKARWGGQGEHDDDDF